MIENNNEAKESSVPPPKVKKPRTQKQIDATARLVESNRMKKELLKKHNESNKLSEPKPEPVVLEKPEPVQVHVAEPEPIQVQVEKPVKPKRVYKKKVVDEKPKFIPPPLDSYSDSSSEEQPEPKQKRLARRFRIH